MKNKKIIHGGNYGSGPSFCGLASTDMIFKSYRHSGGNQVILGYRMFARWCLNRSEETENFKLCEKCRNSPDMAIHILGALERD